MDVLRVPLAPLADRSGMAGPAPAVDAVPIVRIRPESVDQEPLPARTAPFPLDRRRQFFASVCSARDWPGVFTSADPSPCVPPAAHLRADRVGDSRCCRIGPRRLPRVPLAARPRGTTQVSSRTGIDFVDV